MEKSFESVKGEAGESLVSVGIPTYNRPQGLRRTLDCITAQTYAHLEIIVSDNCSPGGEVAEVAHAYARRDARVRVFRQERNRGAAVNFRFVLGAATGRYFMWAADDDEWSPEFVSRCLGGFDREDIVSVMPGFRTLYRLDGTVRRNRLPHLLPERSIAYNLGMFLRRPTPSLLYGLHRRDALDFCLHETEWFDFYDCYLILRLLAQGKIRLIEHDLYTAGVDGAVYEVKGGKMSGWTRLSYFPFWRASAREILRAGVSPLQRGWLLGVLSVTASRLFVGHELRSRN